MIYLDNQSTTPVDKRVLKKMLPFFSENYANPHSLDHYLGRKMAHCVEDARKSIASLIGAETDEIIFTSGATESNNLAIKGSAYFRKKRKNHIITVKTEHKCVIESCRKLELDGFEITFLNVNKEGIIDLSELENAIKESTLIVSVMYANNETGVIQPIKKITAICNKKKILFHSDAAQAIGKININVKSLGIDLMSISAHKMYGPKGVGALYIRKKPRVRLISIMDGGGQEMAVRSGTLPVPLCVGFGEAASICMKEMDEEYIRLLSLRNYLYEKLISSIKNVRLNGSLENRLPSNLNISIQGVKAIDLINNLKKVIISTGSACNSQDIENSYVLSAMGISKNVINSSVRLALGRYSTKKDIDDTVEDFKNTIDSLLNN